MYVRKDSYYRLAKQKGYRSRASFKLQQLNNSYKIIKKNDLVLDIGASPGGWMQVILELIGAKGAVVGIDLLDVQPLNHKNSFFLKGDILEPEIREKALSKIDNKKFDAIVSDLSVNLSGNTDTDIYRNFSMVKNIMGFLNELLKSNGNFLIKLFYSTELKPYLKEIEHLFKSVYITKPDASRNSSSELYMIGKGFKIE